ncbi:MAG: hypothetical protein HY913_03980 [Desulfomonile tiedjei]|nr:hypothetical protein [Desulfomonile tiedjei]
MRTISVRGILIASFILAFSITGVSAQQMPWGPGGGYPGSMGMAPPPPGGGYPGSMGMAPPPFGGGCTGSMCAPPPPTKCKPANPAPCFPNMNAGCSPFPGYNPYGCPPPMCMPSTMAEPAVYVGYLFKDKGAGIDIQLNNAGGAGITSTRNDFDLQGVWLELALPVAVSQNCGLFFTGAHLFPVQTKAVQSYGLITGTARREWQTDVQWWELNGGLSLRLTPFAAALGGFRWSSFVVRFDDPADQLLFTTASDDAKLTTNAYIPFFGLEINCEPSCTTSLRAAVIGFPALPSDVEFRETATPTDAASTRLFSGATKYKSGYFLEALVEAAMRMNTLSLGAFVKFDWLHTDRTRDFTVDGTNVQADIKFDRRNWIWGGKGSVAF